MHYSSLAADADGKNTAQERLVDAGAALHCHRWCATSAVVPRNKREFCQSVLHSMGYDIGRFDGQADVVLEQHAPRAQAQGAPYGGRRYEDVLPIAVCRHTACCALVARYGFQLRLLGMAIWAHSRAIGDGVGTAIAERHTVVDLVRGGKEGQAHGTLPPLARCNHFFLRL